MNRETTNIHYPPKQSHHAAKVPSPFQNPDHQRQRRTIWNNIRSNCTLHQTGRNLQPLVSRDQHRIINLPFDGLEQLPAQNKE